MKYLLLNTLLPVCVACAPVPEREMLSIRSGTMQCTERLSVGRGQSGRIGLSLSSTGSVNTGVSLSVPTTEGASTVEGPTQRCEAARRIAEETARLEQEIRRAELREAVADAKLAEARADAEVEAIRLRTRGLEGVPW